MQQSPDMDVVNVVITGLVPRDPAGKTGQGQQDHEYSETVSIERSAEMDIIFRKIQAMGYKEPLELDGGELTKAQFGHQRFYRGQRQTAVHTPEVIEVTRDQPSEPGKYININETLIEFANRSTKDDLNVNIETSKETRAVCVKDELGLEITFHRTIRMPDDDKLHHLPKSLGVFPLFNVSEFSAQLPQKITNEGGVFLPMWQREALWIQFKSRDPRRQYCLRVSVGRINVITGLSLDEDLAWTHGNPMEALQDYIVIPAQQWLDGICVSPGVVRQFVAMPCKPTAICMDDPTDILNPLTIPEVGSGYSIEGQKTGEEKHGGLQIEIVPSYRTSLRYWCSDKKTSPSFQESKTPLELKLNAGDKLRSYPEPPTYTKACMISDLLPDATSNNLMIKACYAPMTKEEKSQGVGYDPSRAFDYKQPFQPARAAAPPHPKRESFEDDATIAERVKMMGLAGGGKLVQDIYRDREPAHIWNTAAARLLNVHILDPAAFERVTHVVPPPPPISAAEYAKAGIPLFTIEEQVDNRLEGGGFEDVKSVSAMDKAIGVATETTFDPNKPVQCGTCKLRLCDCIIRPCGHQFCNVCIKKMLSSSNDDVDGTTTPWSCPKCNAKVDHVAGFSAPMNLPGEESLKERVPVHVMRIEDGRPEFLSIRKTRV